ncbi:MAG: hypothetical protein LKI23_02025 [Bifidobacterium crudilactis]|nr:hypothetical protein [Bifidobacterium crudilactis]
MNASFAIGNVNIVNECAGDGLLRGYNVVVDGKGTITAVGPRDTTTIPEGCHRVDGRGKYLLPGLINAHVHLFSDGKPLPELLTGATFQHAVSSVLHSPIGTCAVKTTCAGQRQNFAAVWRDDVPHSRRRGI